MFYKPFSVFPNSSFISRLSVLSSPDFLGINIFTLIRIAGPSHRGFPVASAPGFHDDNFIIDDEDIGTSAFGPRGLQPGPLSFPVPTIAAPDLFPQPMRSFDGIFRLHNPYNHENLDIIDNLGNDCAKHYGCAMAIASLPVPNFSKFFAAHDQALQPSPVEQSVIVIWNRFLQSVEEEHTQRMDIKDGLSDCPILAYPDNQNSRPSAHLDGGRTKLYLSGPASLEHEITHSPSSRYIVLDSGRTHVGPYRYVRLGLA
ncbi:hypothetical protein C8J56DRAFT_1067874 [Mycena floridula]|nr:hypothetical protein C8J56DRAFT_1067874 [Mycena floridula]